MKSTGIVRKVDNLGRMVIPKELRRTLDIEEGTPLALYVEGEKIIFKKYEPGCIFCGNIEDITNFKGKKVCNSCIGDISDDSSEKTA